MVQRSFLIFLSLWQYTLVCLNCKISLRLVIDWWIDSHALVVIIVNYLLQSSNRFNLFCHNLIWVIIHFFYNYIIILTWWRGRWLIEFPLWFVHCYNSFISKPIEAAGFSNSFEWFSHNDDKQVHHYWHRKENPAKNINWTKQGIKLYNFHENIRDLIT